MGPARLGRTRRAQRRVFKGKRLRSRGGIDRYCATGGGNFRIGYPTRRLNRALGRSMRRTIKSRTVLVLTSSGRFTVRGIKRGSKLSTLRRRLRGERRIRVGNNVWYVARGRGVRLVYKTRGRRVLEVGIANARLSRTGRAQKRLLRAWELGG